MRSDHRRHRRLQSDSVLIRARVTSVITYVDSAEAIRADQLRGFFVDWPRRPTPEMHLDLLRGSYAVQLALDGNTVVGFVTAISDGVLSAFIPLLEVLPDYRNQGIGKELMRRLLAQLDRFYMVDLCCDAGLEPFYDALGFQVLDRGMGIRRQAVLERRSP
jgi:ribosomal protein S18 acetylase RimI-like enzyme